MGFPKVYEKTVIYKYPVLVISEPRANSGAGKEVGRVGQHFLVLKHDTGFG